MTLTYAAKAALIKNRPVKNDDPQTKLIEELKAQVKTISMELLRANQYIEQVCAISGQPVRKFGLGMLPSNATLKADQKQGSFGGTQVELKPRNLVAKRSMAKLSEQSPYSTASKQHEVQTDTGNQFYAQ